MSVFYDVFLLFKCTILLSLTGIGQARVDFKLLFILRGYILPCGQEDSFLHQAILHEEDMHGNQAGKVVHANIILQRHLQTIKPAHTGYSSIPQANTHARKQRTNMGKDLNGLKYLQIRQRILFDNLARNIQRQRSLRSLVGR